MRNLALALLASILAASPISRTADAEGLEAEIDRLAAEVEPAVIAWRRDLHQHPELSNREFRTAKLVADHLEELRLKVLNLLDDDPVAVGVGPEGPALGRSVGEQLVAVPRGKELVGVFVELRHDVVVVEPQPQSEEHAEREGQQGH